MVLCRDRAFYRPTLRLGGFIVLQNVVVCFVGLADNVMIGAYSQDALSGVALANQIQFLLQMIMGGVSEGMAVLCSQYWGTRQTRPMLRTGIPSIPADAVRSPGRRWSKGRGCARRHCACGFPTKCSALRTAIMGR